MVISVLGTLKLILSKKKTLNFYTKTPNCNIYVFVNTITTANFPINFFCHFLKYLLQESFRISLSKTIAYSHLKLINGGLYKRM